MNKQKNLYNTIELKSIQLTENVFEDMIHSDLTDVDFIYLSVNPSLNIKQINYLFLLQIDNVNINLLRNSHCPDNKINQFIALQDKIYNIAIAHNPNLQQHHINKLLKFNDKDVTMSLEFNNHL